jgi:hypothetical protein
MMIINHSMASNHEGIDISSGMNHDLVILVVGVKRNRILSRALWSRTSTPPIFMFQRTEFTMKYKPLDYKIKD